MLQASMCDICPIAGLFVVVSWISFVVPPDVIPGRMALLITLFLVLVNIFNSVTTNTPKAEGEQVKYKCEQRHIMISIRPFVTQLHDAYLSEALPSTSTEGSAAGAETI